MQNENDEKVNAFKDIINDIFIVWSVNKVWDNLKVTGARLQLPRSSNFLYEVISNTASKKTGEHVQNGITSI